MLFISHLCALWVFFVNFVVKFLTFETASRGDVFFPLYRNLRASIQKIIFVYTKITLHPHKNSYGL